MIIKENVVLYCCEFCNKQMFVKGRMITHELKCKNNPLNIEACRGCIYCEKNISVSYFTDTGYGERESISNCFKCTKLDKLMYPYRAEYKGLPKKYPETFDGQIAMPRVCEFKQEEEFTAF